MSLTLENDCIIRPRREKTCLRRFASKTGADQPAHPRSQISAFVIRFLDNFICKLATGWLVGFVALRPKSTAMVIAGRSVHLTTLFPGQA